MKKKETSPKVKKGIETIRLHGEAIGIVEMLTLGTDMTSGKVASMLIELGFARYAKIPAKDRALCLMLKEETTKAKRRRNTSSTITSRKPSKRAPKAVTEQEGGE